MFCKLYIKLAAWSFALSFLATSQSKAQMEKTPWIPLFKGIEQATGTTPEPRLQVVNALRINLNEPGIAFMATPSNGDLPGDTKRHTGEQFIQEFDVQVAVNTHFCRVAADINWNAEIHGLSVGYGQVVSELEDLPHGGASLLITKDNQARFEKTAPGFNLEGVWTALESWPLFVVNGQNQGDPTTASIHPRTAIGLSQDRRTMIIITIDGRQPGYSQGATYYETAQWLIEFGAYEGINLDGGGSTHLWVSCPQSGIRSLNQPSENRAVGSHLGIFAEPLDASASTAVVLTPIDYRLRISSDAFQTAGQGEWVSDIIQPPFAFDELIYSWSSPLPLGRAFRLYLKAGFGPDDKTDWLYGGFWGPVTDLMTERKKPTFDRGQVDMDWLRLKTKAVSYQFKVVDAGPVPLDAPPTIFTVATKNDPTPEEAESFRRVVADPPPGRVFDVPLRAQRDSKGDRMINRCQSAALASALEFFGKVVALEDIVAHTHDPEYDYPGLWPRVTAAAGEFGFDAYVDRVRDWDDVHLLLSQNRILLASMRMREGECKAPPYRSMGNHIVALHGITDDGRVFVADSNGSLEEGMRGYLCQWLQEDFEKVWMKNKGGVTMVICPPPDFEPPMLDEVPPFPQGPRF